MEKEMWRRGYEFSIRVIRFLKSREWNSFSLVIAKQLLRSATSVGANIVEAKNSSTRNEFRRYYEMALKSCNESKYWICLLRDGFEMNESEVKEILDEAKLLSNVLGASVIKLKNKK